MHLSLGSGGQYDHLDCNPDPGEVKQHLTVNHGSDGFGGLHSGGSAYSPGLTPASGGGSGGSGGLRRSEWSSAAFGSLRYARSRRPPVSRRWRRQWRRADYLDYQRISITDRHHRSGGGGGAGGAAASYAGLASGSARAGGSAGLISRDSSSSVMVRAVTVMGQMARSRAVVPAAARTAAVGLIWAITFRRRRLREQLELASIFQVPRRRWSRRARRWRWVGSGWTPASRLQIAIGADQTLHELIAQ